MPRSYFGCALTPLCQTVSPCGPSLAPSKGMHNARRTTYIQQMQDELKVQTTDPVLRSFRFKLTNIRARAQTAQNSKFLSDSSESIS